MTDHLTLCSEARIRELLKIEQEHEALRAKLAQAEKSAKEWERLAVRIVSKELMPDTSSLEGFARYNPGEQCGQCGCYPKGHSMG